MRSVVAVVAFGVLAASSIGWRPALAQQTLPSVLLIRNARVFDGERLLGQRDVLVSGGRIAAVGVAIAVPNGAQLVDGSGKTLLPGFIDAHTHAYGDGVLRDALAFGVTTELEMFGVPEALRAARAQQQQGKASGRADLFSAGNLVTAPKGHGTEFGLPIPTITSPDSAQAFVDARIAEGSDWIKLVYDDGHAYGLKMPTLSKETMRALVVAAHKRGKLAVVHVGTQQDAHDAIEVGADGLVHTFVDTPPTADFGRFVASHHAFVIPTLAVNLSVTGTGGSAALLKDTRVTAFVSQANEAIMQQGFPRRPGTTLDIANGSASVRLLKDAGVPILAGTDAPNPGTAHGATLHRELELLVSAGLTPTEALVAATSAPAKAFRLGDRGRIAVGRKADLVLVDGDPTSDINATRSIASIWKDGVRFDREAYGKTLADARAKRFDAPVGSESGDVSNFDDGSRATRFGAGWATSTDLQAGGGSSSAIGVVDGGANGTAKSLSITGTIAGPLPYAWSGAMFSPGAAPMQPANLSAKKEIRFWAKGDGQTYRLMAFAQSRGMTPLVQTFVAGPEWKEVVIPFAALGGTDGRDLMTLMFLGGPRPGTFSLQIDDVRLR